MYRQEFYDRLKAAFQPEDKEELEELWQHLSEQIDAMGQASPAGQSPLSLEGIIAALGSPEDIAREYYQDMNIHTALSAEKGVIPAERAEEIAKLKRRLKLIGRLENVGVWLLNALRICFAGAAVFFAMYLLRELFVEARLSAGALVCMLSAGLSTIALRIKKKVKLSLLFCGLALGVIGLWGLSATGTLFYNGTIAAWNWVVPGGTDSINIQANIPLDVAFEHSADDDLHIRLDGKSTLHTQSQLDGFQPGNDGVELILTDNRIFQLFTDTRSLSMIISIPGGHQPRSISFECSEAGVVMDDQSGSIINIHMNEGHIVLNNTRDAIVNIVNRNGDVVLQQQQGCTVDVKSDNGRIILKDNEDISANIQSADCFIRLQDSSCENTTIHNSTGKTVIEDTYISNLNVESNTGDIVVTRQNGQSTLNNGSGSMILKFMQGGLTAENARGTTVVTQYTPLNAGVRTDTGIIRWEQGEGDAVDFRINGGSDENINQFESWRGKADAVVELDGGNGVVKVLSRTTSN